MGPHAGGNHRDGSRDTIRVRTVANAKVVLADINDRGQSSPLCHSGLATAARSVTRERRSCGRRVGSKERRAVNLGMIGH